MARSFRTRLKAFANTLLAPAGLSLQLTRDVFDMPGLLARAAARGLRPGSVIDIGASDGCWSLLARPYFPRATFVLFEPLTERAPELAQLEQRYGFRHIAAAAGDEVGETRFAVEDDLDGSGVVPANSDHDTRVVPVETVDHVVATHQLKGPFVLKLDTHGFEVPILSGAIDTLAHVELLIIEAYNFELQPGCLRFHELCAWLEPHGLRPCDVADPMRRPGDGALWQMDLAFAPKTSLLFKSNSFR
ncbi:FkbM family methyltransferase [Actomonas aquatica]|uniref:FkbM family methyltransferase n=1 Tax=Actomonas aquatica TaxID=2866162 RepID=A0ABZ1CA65_9BACT|nr:FkbM family methyltransferase [Opitutus sp. WL0086]WRQ88398.1 FkbM family methyltransferase [Opitutus sp. WL0086]